MKWSDEEIKNLGSYFRSAGVKKDFVPILVSHCMAETAPGKLGYKLNNLTNLIYVGQKLALKSDKTLSYDKNVHFCEFRNLNDFVLTYLAQLARPRYDIKVTDDVKSFITKLAAGKWINPAFDSVVDYTNNILSHFSRAQKLI